MNHSTRVTMVPTCFRPFISERHEKTQPRRWPCLLAIGIMVTLGLSVLNASPTSISDHGYLVVDGKGFGHCLSPETTFPSSIAISPIIKTIDSSSDRVVRSFVFAIMADNFFRSALCFFIGEKTKASDCKYARLNIAEMQD